MQKQQNKIRKAIIIGIISFMIVASVVTFLSNTTYLSCYVMSFGVVDAYKDQLFNTLDPVQQMLILEGSATMQDANPSFAYMQNAGYEYCLSFAPGLPDEINVEFESDPEP